MDFDLRRYGATVARLSSLGGLSGLQKGWCVVLQNGLMIGFSQGRYSELIPADKNFRLNPETTSRLFADAGNDVVPFCPVPNESVNALYIGSGTATFPFGGAIEQYDLNTLTYIRTVTPHSWARNFVFKLDGNILAATTPRQISTIDESSLARTPLITLPSLDYGFLTIRIRLVRDRYEILAIVEHGAEFPFFGLLRFDLESGQYLGELIPFTNPADVPLSGIGWGASSFLEGPDGNIYVAAFYGITIFDGQTGKFVRNLSGAQLPSNVLDFSFTPDGAFLYIVLSSGFVVEFDMKSQQFTWGWELYYRQTPGYCGWITTPWIEAELSKPFGPPPFRRSLSSPAWPPSFWNQAGAAIRATQLAAVVPRQTRHSRLSFEDIVKKHLDIRMAGNDAVIRGIQILAEELSDRELSQRIREAIPPAVAAESKKRLDELRLPYNELPSVRT